MFFCSILLIILSSVYSNDEEEARASEFHDKIFEPQSRYWKRRFNEVSWKFETNITDQNSKELNDVTVEYSEFVKESWKIFTSYDWRNFKNKTLTRLFYLNSKLGISALEKEKQAKLTEMINNMTEILGETTICDYYNKSCNLQLSPDILQIMKTSRNYDELLYIWQEWLNKCGRPVRKLYEEHIDISNEAARLNGFRTTAEMWNDEFESDTFEQDIESIWLQIKPYYEELHAFVRRRLIGIYGSRVRADGPIPAHILGDPWAQIWTSLYDVVAPYPDKPNLDVTEALNKQGYTVTRMFELSDNFYQSIGLMALPESFWKLSMMTKPSDREVICHPSAWDLVDNDVRIKMCTRIETDHLVVIHHEVGHIQYFLQYSHLPTTFQAAANPGFHEAIGDTMVLSVSTPKHLQEIGLLQDFEDDEETELNFLMLKSLDMVASLPFSYLVDKWRWKVFRGEITPQNYNYKWWEMSKYYQGIEPAIQRTEIDFDPGTKMHIASDYPFISYFVSTILEFQFHEALCRAADQFDPNDPEKPLHKCDIYKNKNAGAIFGAMLMQGSSRPWTDILEELTGSRQLDASSMINFFSPLFHYLRVENKKNNEFIGWKDKRIHSNTLIGLPLPRRRTRNFKTHRSGV